MILRDNGHKRKTMISPHCELIYKLNRLTIWWTIQLLVACVLCCALHTRMFIHFSNAQQWHSTPVLLPGKSHGWRNLVGCSPWGSKESDTTEQLHFHFSLSCIGEGNGNPLQCSCLENPRDEEPGGLPSMGSHRVRHDWSDLAAAMPSTRIQDCKLVWYKGLRNKTDVQMLIYGTC